MKISLFTTCSNPIKRQDPIIEALNCYVDLADEVVVIDGGQEKIDYDWVLENPKIRQIKYNWPKKFDWEFIGQQFQRGYEACTGDWVIRMDLDMFIHEKDMDAIKAILQTHSEAPAISFFKKQFYLVDRFNVKSRMVVCVNKKKYGDRIRFDSGGDLCQPSLDGKEILHNEVPFSGIPIYNYDFSFKSLDVINKDWPRFRNAWNKKFNKDMGEFKDMVVGRYKARQWEKIPIEAHPKYIKDKIITINGKQLGYNLFSWIKEEAYEN